MGKNYLYLSENNLKLEYPSTLGKYENDFLTSKHNPMVQTDISQLSEDCATWRAALRSFREEFTQDNLKLQQALKPSLSKEQLQEVEHLQNQFHIQLINIHDLKQAVKVHNRKIVLEKVNNAEAFQEELQAAHENIFSQYQALQHTLQQLRNEFIVFLSRTQ